MNESLQIRKAGNMISTSVLSRIDPVDFVDTFCCRITAERDIRSGRCTHYYVYKLSAMGGGFDETS